MSKISTYEVVPVPKLADKLIGTSVGGEIEDVTYNFTLQELLDLFIPLMPANNLQGILDFGNTATQDINLFGTITTTYLDVTDTANLFITYLNEETHIVGSLFDSVDSVGTAGQVLTSTGDGVEWFTLPPIFTPNLEQVLTEGNTSSIDILLSANLEALDINTNTATINVNLTLGGTITDNNSAVGSAGQVLSSTLTGVEWISLPVYSATSPLLFNSATGVFSIQQATSYQNGYLSSSDWITFDGKQNAGNYITALTGEATASGPGSATVTLSNAAVIGKVLTGFNPTAGTINASDSILTAFGKTQSQINALVGGVQYQGTWNASTNTPTLTSSVGVQGHYYIVNVAGTTNLNGITDWQVGDWAIFSESTWQKVDNTESVVSVNGFTGAVSLTTDNIPEGTTNLYFLNSRARTALSFAAGSGAYNNTTGVITIPTDNNQILNGAGYITLGSLSASSPLVYNNLTGAFSIPKATSLVDGYLSAADWSTFNGKQNYLGGTGLVKSTAGTISYITDNSGNWNTAYDRSIVSAAVTGTTTKTLTLNEQDGGTITASWTDLDTGLTSVSVSMPSAFSVANSPLTSNGTIAVTGAGTTLEYIDGTGALRTFPGLTGYVPYTGATQNVDLGEFGISAGYFQADLTPTGALQVGRMQWNANEGTMDLRLLGNNVTLQIGQENVTRVVNKSGIDLLEANYQVVRIRKVAEGGAQGQRLAVVLAQGNNENNSTEVIGLVTETINVNQEGFVTSFGEVKSINTTGSLQGETWVDGDILYLSSTVAGALTNVRPVAPNHSVIVGYVVYAHPNNGKIYMAIDTGYELGELHNVYAPSPAANQSIYWNVANSRYQLNTIGGILGYTPANAATLISTTAPLQGGGDLSTNRTFSITQSGASTDGYLSSTDWNTFNNKQPAGSYVPTSRLLSINGTQYDLSADRSWSVGTVTSVAALTLGTSGTDLSSSVANGTTTPVITLNVPTASAANRGALSAADWSTFNTKVGSVTASSPLFSSGGTTPNITIQQASGSQDGYLSSTDWTTFNNKQAAGNYITSLTGEATATGPGAAAVTLNNASVTAKILTGINITGGTVQATDTMLTAFGKLQNQINGLIGSTIYQGTWNASTNTPALASGVGVRGYYYIVSVAGNTNLDGITDWFVGDWAIFDGTAWQQVDNTDAVVSVNGQTGAVSLTTDNIPEGATNQYFLNSRARAALSFTAGSGAYNSTTGVITIPTNTNQLTNGASFITLASLSGTAPIVYSNTTGAISITQAGTASNGYLSSTDWNTFNNKQGSITLTTTGSSGAATLVGNTLNIPNYGSALSGYVPYTGATTNLNLGLNNLLLGSGNSGAYILMVGNKGSNYLDIENAGARNVFQMDSIVHTSKQFGGTKSIMIQTTATTGNDYVISFPDASGTVALTSQIPANPVGGTGTTNTISKWTSSSVIGNSTITDDGTIVKITNTTSIPLNIISSNATRTELAIDNTTHANKRLGLKVESDGVVIDSTSVSGTTGVMKFAIGGTPYMTLLTSGFFGVNETNPRSVLQVTSSGLGDNGGITIKNSGVGGASWFVWPTATVNGEGAGKLITSSNSLANILVLDGATGNVGVNLTSPDRKFYIADGSNTQGTFLAYNQGAAFVATLIEGITDRTANSAFNLMNLKSSTTSMFRVRGDGNLFINGTTGPTLPIIDITASGTGTFMRGVRMLNSGMVATNALMYAVGKSDNSKNMGQFYFYYAGDASNSNRLSMGLHSVDDKFNILGTGNISINTTTDLSAALGVAGAIKAYGGFVASTDGTTNNELSHSGGQGLIGTTTAHPLLIRTGATTAITIDTSQRATFASNIFVNGGYISMDLNATITTISNYGYGGAVQLLRSDATSTRWARIGIVNSSLVWLGGMTINNDQSATFTSTVDVVGGTSSAQYNFGAGGIGMSRTQANNAIWFNSGTDGNHVLWNDYYGGPGARSATPTGFDGMKWNVYRGITIYGGLSGAYTLLSISNSSAAATDHTVTLYASNVARLQTTTSGISVTGVMSSGSISTGTINGGATNVSILAFSCGFSSYTTDGLFSASAVYSSLSTPGASNRVRFGYNDYGGGQYYGAIGFDGPTQFSIGHRYTSAGSVFGIGTGYRGNGVLVDNANTVFIPEKLSIGGWGTNVAGLNLRGYGVVDATNNYGFILDRGTKIAWTDGGNATTGEFIYSQQGSPYSVTIHSGSNNAIACPNTGNVYINHETGTCSIGSTSFSTSYKVYVTGSIYATGDVIAYSDRRKKENIVTIENALEKVSSMRGVFYNKVDEKDRNVGVIAQEVLDVLPEAVSYAKDKDEYGVKYGNIVGVLIEAIKEQQKQIDELKKQLA